MKKKKKFPIHSSVWCNHHRSGPNTKNYLKKPTDQQYVHHFHNFRLHTNNLINLFYIYFSLQKKNKT